MTTRMAASNMELHSLSTGREPRVATVTRVLRQTLFRCWGGAKMTLRRGHCREAGTERRWDRMKGGAARVPETGKGRPKRSRATGRGDVSTRAPDHRNGRGSGLGAV